MKIQDRLRREAEICDGECCVPLVPLLNAAADKISNLEFEIQKLRGCTDDPPGSVQGPA